MNKTMNTPKKTAVNEGQLKTRRIITVSVSIILGILILFGATLGIITGVRRSRYIARLGGNGVSEGVVSFLAATYKTSYMATHRENGVSVSDTDAFWKTEVYNGNTHGDYLKYYTGEYISKVLASARIFDEVSRMTAEDKRAVSIAVDEILTYRASGSVDDFNALCDPMGFDYSDFKEAATLLYKASRAPERVFGEDGSGASALTEECDSFYMRYSRVKMIFIRTEDTFSLDGEGNRIIDSSGNDTLRPLTDDEREERTAYIETLKECIAGINNGSVAPERFDELAAEITERYKENSSSVLESGYYLYANSNYTNEFSNMIPEAVKSALMLDVGECTMVEIPTLSEDNAETEASESGDTDYSFKGVCFMYRAESEEKAYKNTESNFFGDFYALVANDLYENMIKEYMEEVIFSEKWSEVDPSVLPYNSDIKVRF